MPDQLLSEKQIEDFFRSPVWQVIVGKCDGALDTIDGLIENPNPYEHGRAVGARSAYRTLRDMKRILRQENGFDVKVTTYGNHGKSTVP